MDTYPNPEIKKLIGPLDPDLDLIDPDLIDPDSDLVDIDSDPYLD
jgi:hypothetical protein